jgi:hypothetical protein
VPVVPAWKEGAAFGLACVVVRGVVPQLRGAVGHGAETFECRHQFTGGIHLDAQLAATQRRDVGGEALGAGTQARQALGPAGDHAPFHEAFGNRGRSDRGTCADQSSLEQRPAFHPRILVSQPALRQTLR